MWRTSVDSWRVICHLMLKTHLSLPVQPLLENFQRRIAHYSLREATSFHSSGGHCKIFSYVEPKLKTPVIATLSSWFSSLSPYVMFSALHTFK